MSVMMIETHQAVVHKVKKRAFIIHGVLLLLLAVSLVFPWVCRLENDLIRASYQVVKQQLAVLEGRAILLDLLRNKPLSVGQAIEIADVVLDEAKTNTIPAYMVLGIMSVESSFNADAVSTANARGLMQIMPSVWKQYIESDVLKKNPTATHNPALNVRVGIRYLNDLLRQHGDWAKALRVYGGFVSKKPDLYVNAVMARAEQFRLQMGEQDGYRISKPTPIEVRQ